MNVKKFLPLIAAAGLGLIALLVAHSGIGRGAKTPDTTVRVIVAKESVAPGQALTPDNLSEQAIAGTTVPPGAHTSMSDLVGRVTVAPMVPGQPVLDAFLSAPGALPGLPALIPPGMRAVTIDVNETTGVAGMIAPGSRVDIVSVLNQGEHDKVVARTICSDVPVVAVGQRLSANRDASDTSVARTVTLIAKPREAELIRLAFLSASTSLLLRGNGDVGPADSRGVQFTDLEGKPFTSPLPKPVMVQGNAAPTGPAATQPAMVASTAPVSHTRRVQLIEGDKVTTVSFEIPDSTDTDNAVDPDDYTNVETAPVFPNQK